MGGFLIREAPFFLGSVFLMRRIQLVYLQILRVKDSTFLLSSSPVYLHRSLALFTFRRRAPVAAPGPAWLVHPTSPL